MWDMISSFYWDSLLPSLKLPRWFIYTPKDMEAATLGHWGTEEVTSFVCYHFHLPNPAVLAVCRYAISGDDLQHIVVLISIFIDVSQG